MDNFFSLSILSFVIDMQFFPFPALSLSVSKQADSSAGADRGLYIQGKQ